MALFDEYGNYTGPDIPSECVDECTTPGQAADESVAYWRKRLSFSVPRNLAIGYLREFGAWTPEELTAKNDDELADTVLWIACGDIVDQGDWIGLMH